MLLGSGFSGVFSQNLQSPSEFLGYELGSAFTRHADVIDYFQHLDEYSSLLQFNAYGKTSERRTLGYAVISAAANLENLEQIRQQHLQTTGISEPSGVDGSDKAVVWLSYNVHGNEASSTEAAMRTAYELVSSRQDLLEDLIIIMDPNLNPDGRDRYVNWYNQVQSFPYDKSQVAAEHHEPWPGGRPNHYLFDLNRDWMWATQTETRQRLEIYNQWMPHIHVDFHEQGINEPYYFAPAAEPFHQQITTFQREFQTEIGKNHAQYFDEHGWLFFTRERFDLLYPSYGDTYPTFMGAIGMTYEQAGHGRAGLGIETDEGYELTLKDRIEHHFTTGISTLEIAARNKDRLVREFEDFFKNRSSATKAYALRGHPDKLKRLADLLDRHQILYGESTSGNIRGYHYQNGNQSGLSTEGSTMIVPLDQPKGRMVEVLFEPDTELVDSLTYDITAWSLPFAYGLEAVASTRDIDFVAGWQVQPVTNIASSHAAGYIAPWNSMEDARFLSALLQEGIRVRFSELPLRSGAEEFPAGSLIITGSDNRNTEDFHERLMALADRHQRQLYPAASSFATTGPDFGSPSVKIINDPKIAVLKGEGVSSLSYGEIWYYFEQELQYPLTSIDLSYFRPQQLIEFDVLIIPSLRSGNLFDNHTWTGLEDWIRRGGKVVTLESAAGLFAQNDSFDLESKPDPEDDKSFSSQDVIPYAKQERDYIKHLITGSIIKTQMDPTHPMAFGYSDSYYSMKLGTASYSLLKGGSNVGYLGADPEVVAGFAGSEARKMIPESLTFGMERFGRGSVVYLIDNPLFRGFWENGKLLMANSLFFVENDRITR